MLRVTKLLQPLPTRAVLCVLISRSLPGNGSTCHILLPYGYSSGMAYNRISIASLLRAVLATSLIDFTFLPPWLGSYGDFSPTATAATSLKLLLLDAFPHNVQAGPGIPPSSSSSDCAFDVYSFVLEGARLLNLSLISVHHGFHSSLLVSIFS